MLSQSLVELCKIKSKLRDLSPPVGSIDYSNFLSLIDGVDRREFLITITRIEKNIADARNDSASLIAKITNHTEVYGESLREFDGAARKNHRNLVKLRVERLGMLEKIERILIERSCSKRLKVLASFRAESIWIGKQ